MKWPQTGRGCIEKVLIDWVVPSHIPLGYRSQRNPLRTAVFFFLGGYPVFLTYTIGQKYWLGSQKTYGHSTVRLLERNLNHELPGAAKTMKNSKAFTLKNLVFTSAKRRFLRLLRRPRCRPLTAPDWAESYPAMALVAGVVLVARKSCAYCCCHVVVCFPGNKD